jgi:TrpR-related protein YerC/YecD
MNNKHKCGNDALYELIAKIKTKEEAKDLLADLCTPGEIVAMSQRLMAAELLMDGQTYEQVIKATDISSATLSRVSKCVKKGKGYAKFLSKKE